jgi:F0F1-type ATP synthase assembly protein I
MTAKRNAAADAADAAAAAGRAQGLDTGWAVVSYLVGGMIAYGGIGWLIGRAVHVSLLFPAGMLVGMAISIGYIIHRYGRPGQGGTGGKSAPRDRGAPGSRAPGPALKEMTGDR